MSIFALHLNGQEFLTENFRQAMRTAAVILIPDEAERQEVKRLAWFSGLSEMRSQGSFNQYLRYLNGHQGGLSFRIDEHELGGPPASPTLRKTCDLNSGFDPGFDLQATLWDIGFQRTALPIDTLADGLFDRISRSITDARASGPDQNVLDELRTLEQRMGGINVIPTIGKASSILDRLPDRVGELFADIASQAFAKHHRHQV